jgi:hypothetical protein
MAKMWKDMTAQERADVTAGKITDSTGGLDPNDPMYKDAANNVGNKGWNFNILRKPDPEVDAGRQISDAVNRPDNSALMGQPVDVPGLPPGMSMDLARKTMNPATGLPYSVGQPAVDPEQRLRLDQASGKAEMQQRASAQSELEAKKAQDALELQKAFYRQKLQNSQ